MPPTSRLQASTTVSGVENGDPIEITPKYCCNSYFGCNIFFFLVFFYIVFLKKINVGNDNACYMELFAHSVSVSNVTNANVSTADWRIGLIAKSPLTGCKLPLNTVTSRLLRGDEVISVVSPSLDDFGKPVTSKKTYEPVTTVDFKSVVTPGVVGSVIWDYRVEIGIGLTTKVADSFLIVTCRDIPVKFTAEAAGNVTGSLLGNMRRCGYLFQQV